MQLNLLHLDDALTRQTLFRHSCAAYNAHETDAIETASYVRLWGKDTALETLRKHLDSSLMRSGNDTMVTFMGSGDFHHVSALLIAMLAETTDEPFTIIHFDNHPDWVHFSGGMHCGSWINRALSLPQLRQVITIGVCSNDLIRPHWKGANLEAWREGKILLLPWHAPSLPFSTHNIDRLDEEAFLQALLPRIATRNVYITIDKDVLSHADAITNWDQGHMPLDRLLGMLRAILARHHAIGIDINGDYSTPSYNGTFPQRVQKKTGSLARSTLAETGGYRYQSNH